VDYFPHFHFQAAAALANENYDLLQEYWGSEEPVELTELLYESHAVEKLENRGAVETISDLELDQ